MTVILHISETGNLETSAHPFHRHDVQSQQHTCLTAASHVSDVDSPGPCSITPHHTLFINQQALSMHRATRKTLLKPFSAKTNSLVIRLPIPMHARVADMVRFRLFRTARFEEKLRKHSRLAWEWRGKLISTTCRMRKDKKKRGGRRVRNRANVQAEASPASQVSEICS